MLLILVLACAGDADDARQGLPRDQWPRLGDTADTGGDGQQDTDGADSGGRDSGTDSGGADSGADSGGGDTGPDEDARAEACHPDVAGWPEDWKALEDDVLDLVNDMRERGADCGAYGRFGAVDPLEMDPEARCAARYHSLWMAESGSFAHESPGGDLGDSFDARMRNAGYRGSPYGENIAAGYATARDVMAGWMASDGHCANIMASYPTKIGVGFYQGGSWSTYWTQDFGY